MPSIDIQITTSPAPAQKLPVLYKGEENTIKVTLTNATGNAIALKSGSTIYVTFSADSQHPDFMQDALPNMNIQKAGWGFSYDSGNEMLSLKHSNSTGSWVNNEPLSFTITGVKSSASPVMGNIQVAFLDFGTSLDVVSTPISLAIPPKQGNPKLSDVLDVQLLNGGDIFVSSHDQAPLVNSLFLNIKNKSQTKPIFQGTQLPDSPDGPPQIIVSFAYGSTSGALCPIGTKGETGTAWEINGKQEDSQGNAWTVSENKPIKKTIGKEEVTAPPQWTLTPVKSQQGHPGNTQLIGSGEHANITFDFYNIVSYLPIGTTTMYLQFQNFPQTEHKWYDGFSMALNITKKPAPPERGVIAFSATEASSNIAIEKWGEEVKAEFNWIVFEAASVQLTNEARGSKIDGMKISYDMSASLHYSKSQKVDLSNYTTLAAVAGRGTSGYEKITFNLFAYQDSAYKQQLANSKQFDIAINYPPVDVQFERTGAADELNPEIKITLTPKAFVNTGSGNVTLTFKDITKSIDNHQEVKNSLVYTGKFFDLFGRYLDVGTNTTILTVQQTDGRDPVTVSKTWRTDLPALAIDFELNGTQWVTANPTLKVKVTSKYDLVESITLSTKGITRPIPANGNTYAIQQDAHTLFGRYFDVGRNEIVLTIHRKDGLPSERIRNRFYAGLIDTRGPNPETYRVSFLAGSSLLWMAENLRYLPENLRYPPPPVRVPVSKNGRLYDWSTANHSGTAPPGWRLPTAAEWEGIINAYGGLDVEGVKVPGFTNTAQGAWYSGLINKFFESPNLSGFWSKDKYPDDASTNGVYFDFSTSIKKPTPIDGILYIFARYVLDTYNIRLMYLFPRALGVEYGDWPTNAQLAAKWPGLKLRDKDRVSTAAAVFAYYRNTTYWGFPTWQLSTDAKDPEKDFIGTIRIPKGKLPGILTNIADGELIETFRTVYKIPPSRAIDLNDFNTWSIAVIVYYQNKKHTDGKSYIGLPTFSKNDQSGTREVVLFPNDVGILTRYCYDPLLKAATRLAYQMAPDAEVNLDDPYTAGTAMAVWAQQFEKDYFGGVPTWQSGGRGAVRIPMSTEEYDFLQGKQAEREKEGRPDKSKFKEAISKLRIEVS